MQRSLTAATVSSLDAYFDELARWSARLNLTSIPRERMWSRNVGDAQALLDLAAPDREMRVIDVGSGGGAPGMIVAILRPDLRVTLLESDVRKGGFLVHVAGLLGLTNVEVETIRAEDAGRTAGPARERSTWPHPERRHHRPCSASWRCPCSEWAGPSTRSSQGRRARSESCARAAAACGGGPPEAPAPGLLRVGKIAPTSLEYPRRAGVPSRRPLS